MDGKLQLLLDVTALVRVAYFSVCTRHSSCKRYLEMILLLKSTMLKDLIYLGANVSHKLKVRLVDRNCDHVSQPLYYLLYDFTT